MRVARTTIGDADVLIETVSDELDVVGGGAKRQTQLTGIDDTLKDAYDRARHVIKMIAQDVASDLKDVLATSKGIQLEFSRGKRCSRARVG